MPKYAHWTQEPCLHTADLSRRLRLAARRWLEVPAYRAAWEQRLAEMKQDPETARDLEGASVEDALTNGVVAAILIEQGLLRMDIPRGDEGPRPN